MLCNMLDLLTVETLFNEWLNDWTRVRVNVLVKDVEPPKLLDTADAFVDWGRPCSLPYDNMLASFAESDLSYRYLSLRVCCLCVATL